MDSFDRQLEERPHSSLQLVEGVAEPAFGAEAFVKKPGLALTVSCKTRSLAHSTRHSKGPRSASRHRRLRSRRALRIVTADIAEPTPAASVLQASGFRSDVTVFRLNARPRPKTGSESAFRRNTAERVYLNEAAHNPEVAGSNPAPATEKGSGNRAFPLPGHHYSSPTAATGSRPRLDRLRVTWYRPVSQRRLEGGVT
jgi:hypothetical protein